MILRNRVNEIMADKKDVTKNWSIKKILAKLELNNVEDAIAFCENKITEIKYSVATDWKGQTPLHYHFSNGNLLLTLDKDNFDKNSLDVYFYTFANSEEKLRVYFDICGGLTQVEKFNF